MTSSVLITNYNYARHIEAAVSSVVAQSTRIREIVVVDDGSTDDSREVIDRLFAAHPMLIVPLYQSNTGQAAAINAGFARCTGDLIHMLDADDVWDAKKVERVEAAFALEPQAVMAMHRLRHIDGEGRVTRDPGCDRRRGGDLSDLTIRTGGTWLFGATSSLSFARRTLEQILPLPALQFRLCADGALAYPAAFLGETLSLDDVLGGYRIHGSNNHYAAGLNAERVQADVEMTNQYLNAFLARIGRTERVDLSRNLSYRRDRYYRHGGGLTECMAVVKLILSWPLYSGPIERANFLARFCSRCLTRSWSGR